MIATNLKNFFIQETEDELLEHIKNCETCRLEYERMLVTEKIIKEAKPYFAAKKETRL